jgi:aspartyl-tRNA(Asn)/glutamyl-tRNA(Gln) amidotransferase subunit A
MRKGDRGLPLGKLHGVVVALKDVISYKDHTLTAGSRIWSGFKAIYHATVVEKLLAEDAIIIGRNNCDEFAMGSTNENSAYGKVLNARDQTRVPGGSSGGAPWRYRPIFVWSAWAAIQAGLSVSRPISAAL